MTVPVVRALEMENVKSMQKTIDTAVNVNLGMADGTVRKVMMYHGAETFFIIDNWILSLPKAKHCFAT